MQDFLKITGTVSAGIMMAHSGAQLAEDLVRLSMRVPKSQDFIIKALPKELKIALTALTLPMIFEDTAAAVGRLTSHRAQANDVQIVLSGVTSVAALTLGGLMTCGYKSPAIAAASLGLTLLGVAIDASGVIAGFANHEDTGQNIFNLFTLLAFNFGREERALYARLFPPSSQGMALATGLDTSFGKANPRVYGQRTIGTTVEDLRPKIPNVVLMSAENTTGGTSSFLGKKTSEIEAAVQHRRSQGTDALCGELQKRTESGIRPEVIAATGAMPSYTACQWLEALPILTLIKDLFGNRPVKIIQIGAGMRRTSFGTSSPSTCLLATVGEVHVLDLSAEVHQTLSQRPLYLDATRKELAPFPNLEDSLEAIFDYERGNELVLRHRVPNDYAKRVSPHAIDVAIDPYPQSVRNADVCVATNMEHQLVTVEEGKLWVDVNRLRMVEATRDNAIIILTDHHRPELNPTAAELEFLNLTKIRTFVTRAVGFGQPESTASVYRKKGATPERVKAELLKIDSIPNTIRVNRTITPPPGTFDLSPYRVARSLEATRSNLLLTAVRIKQMFASDNLRREVLRTRALSHEQRVAEATRRYNPNLTHISGFMTATEWNQCGDIALVSELLRQLGFKPPYSIASFALGYYPFDSVRSNLDGALAHAAAREKLTIKGATFEGWEMLGGFLPPGVAGELHLFDWDNQVLAAMQQDVLVYPLYDMRGRPIPNVSGNSVARLMQNLGDTNPRIVSSGAPYNLPVAVVRPSPTQRQKINPHRFDMATENMPATKPFDAVFFKQASYFMDPLVQFANFARLVHRTDKFILSDFLLDDCEASLLGLTIVHRMEVHSISSPHPNADRYIYLYQKALNNEDNPFLMDIVAAVDRAFSA